MLSLLLATAVAQAAPITPPDAALQALGLDQRQDGAADPTGRRIAELLGAACGIGHALSCDAKDLPRGDAAALHPVAQAACDAGDPLGCVVAGWTLAEDPDEAAATALYRQACDAGYPRGCAELAAAEYRAGDKEGGRARAAAACEAGVGNACLVAGWGLEAADKRDWNARGCALGDPASCTALGDLLWEKDVAEPDHDRAFALFTEACGMGSGEACNRLGQTHAWGTKGKKKSLVRAVEAYRLACDHGYEWGCANAGTLLAKGVLGEREVQRGEDLLAQACDAGLGRPCWNLGAIEVPRSLDAGSLDAAWARMSAACDDGFNKACAWLGTAQLAGLKTGTPDRAAALDTWHAACFEREEFDACMALGSARAAAGEDAAAAWGKGCDLGSDPQCEALARAPGAARGVTLRDVGGEADLPKTRGLANHRSIDRANDLARAVYREPTSRLQARAVTTLLGDAADRIDPGKAAPWTPALEAACAEHEPGACTVIGRARLEAGDADAAAAAFADGCGIGRLNRPVCDRLEDVLVEHKKTVSKEARAAAVVLLCESRRPAFCKEAAKGFKKTDPDRVLGLLRHGCAAEDAWACDQVEKVTGAPMKVGVGGLVGATGVQVGPRGPMVGADPIILGPVTRPQVEATIQATMPALKACYAAALDRDPATRGRVDAKLIVQADGRVKRVSLTHDTTGDADLAGCLTGALMEAAFPATDAGQLTIVRHPFDLQPEEGQPE